MARELPTPPGSADLRGVVDALVQTLPGRALVRVAADLPGIHLVGGAVRDLLVGATPRELDVVVEGDPAELIARLAGSGGRSGVGGLGRPDHEADGPAGKDLEAEVVRHTRFGTASVEVDGGRIDIARARRERYPVPGALPEVEPAPLAEDLLRRDFTVNAIAVGLPDGRVATAPGGLGDLAARRLRVLHDASFVDDPTRALRLARLAVRLGFTVEAHTAELAAAVDLSSVSGARIGAELRLALAEPDPVAALAAFAELPGLPLDVDRDLARRASELLGAGGRLDPDGGGRSELGGGGRSELGGGGRSELGYGGRLDLLLLAAATRRRADPAWLGRLELTAAERDVVLAAWEAGPLARAIASAATPSELRSLLARQPPEAVALAGALGPAAAAGRWLGMLRHVGLEIDGDDLVAAGIAPGPELGQRLERTLARKLDGELVGGREAELVSALSDPAEATAGGLEAGLPAGLGGRGRFGHRRLQGPDRRLGRRLE